MKYKCLILDHDDTVVNSSQTIHYPAFIEFLKIKRPHLVSNYTFESFINKNFNPGILELLRDEVGLSEEELLEEEQFWADFVEGHTPLAYPGMRELIARFVSEGGIVAVASHSLTRYIERDYAYNALTPPHVIYGWDMPKADRKPSPKSVLLTLEKFALSKSDVLVVDDLKPGYDMARAAAVDFAAAGWAYDSPEIERFMRKNCDFYLDSVEELARLVFS